MYSKDVDPVDVVAEKQVRFPSASSSTKPKKSPKKKKTEDTARLLGMISRGEA